MEKKETPPAPEKPVEAAAEIEEAAIKTPEKKDEVMRAEAPELRGLKIMGKIDADKLERPKRKKKKDRKDSPKVEDKKKAAPAPAPKPKADDDGQPRKKRRRTRKKVNTASDTSGRTGAPGRTSPPGRASAPAGKGRRTRGGKEDDVKEVSQKEIEEKIKATMARISGGGKRKRQKLRRDNRERMRERRAAGEGAQGAPGGEGSQNGGRRAPPQP